MTIGIGLGIQRQRATGGTTDPTAPGQVANLTATSGDTQVILAWSPPYNGGSPITGYLIERKVGAGGWDPLTTVTIPEHIDPGLSNGTPYTYRVTAINAIGSGPVGNEASATPAVPATAPDQITDLTATAGNEQVTLDWSAPADGGSPIRDYLIERKVGAGNWGTLTTVTSPGHLDENLSNGTLYTYRVTARNDIGSGPVSDPVEATPSAVQPWSPLDLFAAYPAAEGYFIDFSRQDTVFSAEGVLAAPGQTVFKVKDLKPGTDRYFMQTDPAKRPVLQSDGTSFWALGNGISNGLVTDSMLPQTGVNGRTVGVARRRLRGSVNSALIWIGVGNVQHRASTTIRASFAATATVFGDTINDVPLNTDSVAITKADHTVPAASTFRLFVEELSTNKTENNPANLFDAEFVILSSPSGSQAAEARVYAFFTINVPLTEEEKTSLDAWMRSKYQ